jgi:hypothetical protein
MKGKDAKRRFCDGNESIGHLFFDCPLAKYVWDVIKCTFYFDKEPSSFSAIWGVDLEIA